MCFPPGLGEVLGGLLGVEGASVVKNDLYILWVGALTQH